MLSVESVDNFRNYYVAFSNEFATNSCYSYTLYEQRIFMYILAKIPSYDGKRSNKQETIEIDFNHFINIFHLPASGATYKKIRDALFMLPKIPVLGTTPLLSEIAMKKKTIYEVKISQDLEKHFFNLRSYVQFPLLSVMEFSSVYSYQIYAALLSRFNRSLYFAKKDGNTRGLVEEYKYEPDEIIKMLNLEQPSYRIYKNLNAAVIKKVVKDINDYGDLMISYQGNNNVIIFSVRYKTSDEQLSSYALILSKFGL